jgi:uroporphyrin-III C-methyltransferase / precorrin-2 dehydrogenase / sirohydrochlorin ferrochelatase
MQHLPLFADLTERRCLVVGGGAVAERRVRLLLEAGADIDVLAPELSSRELQTLAADGGLRYVPEPFPEDRGADLVAAYWLVVAATDDRALNACVARAAEAAQRFCNVVDDPALCSFIMPAIVDRSPVTIAIGSGGRSPVLARWIKGLLETLLPARLGALAELTGRWRTRVRDAVPGAAARRQFWEGIVAGEVANLSLAGRAAEADAALARALDDFVKPGAAAPCGEAYLVGAGPGSPDLLTIRGRQLLASADIVLYDRLVGPELLQYARRDAELISVGKTPHRPSITQRQINRLLVRLVESGKRVCRLKGGDPMVFGRGGEEVEALVDAGVRFQIVPGVSAAEGCAAYAGIPLTLRGVSQAVLLTTGHTPEAARAGHLANLEPGQTLALYMGVGQYADVCATLMDNGHAPDTPVAIIENGTTDRQRVVRTVLQNLVEARDRFDIRPPALLIVGETTRLAERYSWFAPGKLEIFAADTANELARASY